jgi:hypothetical protein
MNLVAGQRWTDQLESILETAHGRISMSTIGIRPENRIETRLHKFLQGGLPLCGSHLCPVEQVIRKVNGCLHWL